jgi:ATP-dependent DNA helicase RecQ
MAYGLQDVITLRQFMQDSDAPDLIKRVEHHKLEAMLGLCELITCRRHALLAYFDEKAPEQCGQCDNCQNPPEHFDATEVAQKALSCVFRSGQRFGVNYLIDILLGNDDERIKSNQHDQLSTFGIGTELNATQWRGIFRQLIATGYLDIDINAYGALKLTEKCRAVLRGEQTLLLRKQQERQKTAKSGKKQTTVRPQDEALWEALRQYRAEIAKTHGVPPYVIFHDATLQEMCQYRPADLEAMRRISGVGEQKLSQYGQQFVDIIRRHPLSELLNNGLSDTVNQTLMLHEQGLSPIQIATDRALKESTVYSHLAEGINAGLLDIKNVLDLQEADLKEIIVTIESLGEQAASLKTLYQALDEQYDYGILRCVQASLY